MSAVTQPGDDYYNVYQGFWTNWSDGKIKGATITLSRQNGGFLVAFLAIFVGATGKSFWRIGCFLFHRYFSSSAARSRNALYHQRQAILRNADTAEDGAIRLLKAIWVWWRHARLGLRRPLLDFLPVAVFGLIIYGGFGAAGIYSSHVTTQTANEVLIAGSKCGPLGNPGNSSRVVTILQPYFAQRGVSNLNYALQCYTNSSNEKDCNTFVKPRLPLSVRRDASCPFADEMCLLSGNENLLLDTGYLDSNNDLGINAPKKERFQIRFAYQCGPIVTEGFKKLHTETNASGVPLMRYYYGNTTTRGNLDYRDFAYQVPVNFSSSDFDDATSFAAAAQEYGLMLLDAYAGDSQSAKAASRFIPIPKLQRDDGDVMLFFLSAPGIVASAPIDDPWYSAHVPGPPIKTAENNSTIPSYMKDEPATVMGCTQQIQLCNPNLPQDSRCAPMSGLGDLTNNLAQLWPSQAEQNTQNWAMNVLESQIFDVASTLIYVGISSLTSRYSLQTGIQSYLPSNQWQLELEHWIGGTLASLQAAFADSANGPPSSDLYEFQILPEDAQSRSMCNNQKIISSTHTSFSVLGVSIILVLGSLIILLDTCLEPFMNWFQRRRNCGLYQRLEWQANSILQLQRLAHEGIGYGTWSMTDEENPVTLPEEQLAILSIGNEKHPVLISASPLPGKESSPSSLKSPTLYGDEKEEQRLRKYQSSEEKTRICHTVVSEKGGCSGHDIDRITVVTKAADHVGDYDLPSKEGSSSEDSSPIERGIPRTLSGDTIGSHQQISRSVNEIFDHRL